MRHALLSLGAVLLSLIVSLTEAAARPNVIVVLSDDQGFGDFSLHGNPVLKTPNLDALARQSVRLMDFHVAPMCTPTRGQLMTGMDACRNGAKELVSMWGHPDQAEGPLAFTEKREANWQEIAGTEHEDDAAGAGS